MKRFFIAGALLLMAISPMFGQQMEQLPIDPAIRYGKLENGMTYYIRHNEKPEDRVSFYIAQKVGSVQEDDSQRGLAHFLEHMCFNGSVNYPGDGELIKYCESIGVKFGANLNAYTSTDETVYNIDDVPVTPENIEGCLKILHDWADGLLLEEGEIDKERGVIHEEWRMRSSATQRLLERQLPALYPGSKYGYRMPIGLMEVVDNFAPEVLRNYYETWYRPDLQGLIIVGDIDVDQIEAQVKELFGPIRMPENPIPYEYYPVPDNEEAIYVVDSDPELQQTIIEMFFKVEPMGNEMNGTLMRLIQDGLTRVISFVLNERFGELAQQPDCPFLVAQVAYGNYLVSKTMDALEVALVPRPGVDPAEAVTAVVTELERAARFGLTDSEVSRAKQELLSSLESVYDNRDKQDNSFFIDQYVRHFLENVYIPDIETEYQLNNTLAPQVPLDTYNQTLSELVSSYEKNFVLMAFFTQKEGETIPDAAGLKAAVEAGHNADIEAFVDNAKDEPLISVLPKPGKIKKETAAPFGYTKLELGNGANVYYKQTDFNNSQVILSGRSFGGNSLLEESQLIDAAAFSDIINNTGLGNFNSVELSKALAGKQVGLSINLSSIQEQVSGSSTPKDLRTLFELLYLRFQEPYNDENAYNSIISSYRTQLESASKVPTMAFQDSITATVYAHHPRVKEIRLENIDQISYDGVKKIFKERFASAGDFDFFVTGNFDVDSLKTFVKQYVASLPKAKKRESYKDWNITPVGGVVVNRFTRSMETPQAYMLQLYSGENPYTLKNDVTISAFGNIIGQRYLKSIREDSGLSYSVSTASSVDYGIRDTYMLQTVTPFTPIYCDSVLFLLDKGMEDIARDGVTEEELETVRQYELKNYSDSQKNNSYWQSLIVNSVLWNKDLQTGYEDAVKALSSDDIRSFVSGVLKKQNNCTTVIMLPEDTTE